MGTKTGAGDNRQRGSGRECGGNFMSLISLLSTLKESGISVLLVEDNLKINGPKEKLTPELLEEIKEHKEQITFYLQGILKKNDYRPIEAVEKKEYYELSSAQRRLYLIHRMTPDSTVYNMPMNIIFTADFDIDKLESVFKQLISRHESFRTSFKMVDGRPVQRIHDKVEFEFQYYELATEDNSFIRPFDLSKAPLLRCLVVNTGNSNHLWLLIDMHHIISDGTSQAVLEREFATLKAGKELPLLKLQYKDYAEWQNSSQQREWIKKQEPYWLKEFSGELPVLNLPADYPRPLMQSFEGNKVYFDISRDHTHSLKTIALEENATLYMVLLAVFNIFLAKLSSQEDIIIGTPTAGRRHADLQSIIGMFVNTIVLRNYPEGEKTFREFLGEVKKRTLTAFVNQDYPFEYLVDRVSVGRDASRNPLFDVMFVMQTQMEREQRPAKINSENTGAFDPMASLNSTAKFDLTLDAAEENGELHANFECNTRLFKGETLYRFINHFTTIAARVCENPDQRISDIQFISEKEKRQLVMDFNATETPYPNNRTIHQLFEEQAARTPDGVAVNGMGHMTYSELNRKSNQLAEVLKEKGVLAGVRRTQPINSIVGIMVERSLEMIIGILGILKAGAAYLPIDPDYPQERIDFMLKDSNAKLLVTTNNLEAPDFPLLPAAGHRQPATSLAYVIYTSGSTGKPKGVMVEHRNAVNTLVYRKEEYKMGMDDTSLQLFSYAFDGFVTDFFTPVISGARVVLLSEEEIKDIGRINQAIVKHKITHFISFPGLFQGIIESLSSEETVSLKVVTLAGDMVLPHIIEKTIQKNPHIEIAIEYGVTESAVMSTIYRHQEKDTTIKIGRPIGNTCIYILDRYYNLLPIGVPGELCVAGDGVTRGYLNNPELSTEKFLSGYYRSYRSYRTYIPSKIIYKTGDLARWLADGNIEFLGRIDHQMKIRGFRIEPGEIENQLLRIEGINDAAVIARKDNTGQKYICAYIVSKTEVSISPKEIKTTLARLLPTYMIPAFVIPVDYIPLTPNGKVDRRALPASPLERTTNTHDVNYEAPRNEMEEKMTALWAEILGLEKDAIGIRDDFFELGGHSLKVAILETRIHKAFNVRIPLREIYRTPTVEALCSIIPIAGWIREEKQNRDANVEDEEDEVIL
jgi:amino acid adenylation domain-containing protein